MHPCSLQIQFFSSSRFLFPQLYLIEFLLSLHPARPDARRLLLDEVGDGLGGGLLGGLLLLLGGLGVRGGLEEFLEEIKRE